MELSDGEKLIISVLADMYKALKVKHVRQGPGVMVATLHRLKTDNRMEDADENTLIIANSARLLRDATLLADHERFASAFALAVLGVEEIGKVILKIWDDARPFVNPKLRSSAHIRKQAAVASLLLASFSLREFGDAVVRGPVTDELIERVAKAFYESQEGRFLSHARNGVLERTKHISLYWDDWLAEHSLHQTSLIDLT